MNTLETIDSELTNQFEVLTTLVSDLHFNEVKAFRIEEAKTVIPWNELSYPGIYLLEVKNNGVYDSFTEWVNHFKAEWEDEKYLRKFTPNFKKIRIKAHEQLEDWIPLYLGKSKNVGGRVHEHIYKELDKSTFALKLMARENLKNDLFRLKAMKIEVANYDAIVPRIESQLRNTINPLIGKQ